MLTFTSFVENKEILALNPLPYKDGDLEPVMSKATIDYHYKTLAAGYVKKFNKEEGDPVFNKAGAFLHNIFFPQLMPPVSNNKPEGMILQLINDKFGSFDNFKKEFEKVAMSIQGSGWVYLSKDGTIKTIKNHQVKNDIVLLVDWWEHAWALDYQADKKKYLENIWSIIDWSKVTARL
jgi:Fe-Mn family superoxide dismutase